MSQYRRCFSPIQLTAACGLSIQAHISTATRCHLLCNNVEEEVVSAGFVFTHYSCGLKWEL